MPALISSARCQPQWSITQPPTSAPAAVEAMPAPDSSAFAASSCEGGTISGAIALLAGRKNTLQVKSTNTIANTGATPWTMA